MSSRRVLIVAGEVSGDIHAGNMLTELRGLVPEVDSFGVGGDRLAAAGLTLVARTEQLAHMGLVEVLRELPRIRRLMDHLVREARQRRPAVAVLVDSPDFNLRLAARLKKLGIPVVLYVSPQLWAWRRGRVRTVRELAREVLCILPFEVEFYRANGARARYVGHPLVDEIGRVGLLDKPSNSKSGRLALLPGSRSMEVRQLLPVMVRALRSLGLKEVREAVLIEAPGMKSEISKVLAEHGGDPRLQRAGGESRRRVLSASTLAWTASGTATLECTLLDVPMIVGYRLQPISYALAKFLVKVPNVALVNLIAGSAVAPELLQKNWNPERLVAVTEEMLAGGARAQMEGLAEARSRLGGPGASLKAAQAVAEYLD